MEAGDSTPRTTTERAYKKNQIQSIKKEREIRQSLIENSISKLKIFLGDLKRDEIKKP